MYCHFIYIDESAQHADNLKWQLLDQGTWRKITHSSLWHVVPRPEPRLEEAQVHDTLRYHNIVDLDGEVPRRGKDVDAFVRIFRVDVDRSVFFIPGVWSEVSPFVLAHTPEQEEYPSYLPIAANSSLVKPASCPCSKTRIRPVDFAGPWSIAREARFPSPTGSLLVIEPGSMEELST